MKNIKIEDNIKVSDKLDDYILMGLEKGIEEVDNIAKEDRNYNRKNKKSPLKVAILVLSLSATAITTTYAIEKIIEYFNYNKDSIYKHEEKDIATYGESVTLSSKDKGIELKIDNIAVDDSFLNIIYTVKSDKKISEINEDYKDPVVANPFLDAIIEKKESILNGPFEIESTFVSDYELKGILRYSMSRYDIKDSINMELKTDEIFGKQGDWSIEFKIDKTSINKQSHKFNINKGKNIVRTYDHNGKDVDVNFDLNVDNVVLSPLGNQITLTETVDTQYDEWSPNIGNSFALFDENNKSLDIIDKGYISGSANMTVTNPFEFLKANNNLKSITLVPFDYEEGPEDDLLKVQSIDKLPITFTPNKYGKVIIENIEISEDEIKYTYYKDGVVPFTVDLIFCDENGEDLWISGLREVSVDRENGKYTVYRRLSSKEDKEKVSKVKSISMYSNNRLRLSYKDKIEFDLR